MPIHIGYPIKVTVRDDAGGEDGRMTYTSVWNVAPEFRKHRGCLQSFRHETTYVLEASFLDPGLLDTHTATIEWGDGTIESWDLEQGARDFRNRTQRMTPQATRHLAMKSV